MVVIAESMVKHGTLTKTGFQTSRVVVVEGSKIGASSRSSIISMVRFKKRAISAAVAMEVADRLENEATPWLMLAPEVDGESGDKIDRFYSLCDGVTVRLNRKKSFQVPNTTKCIASTAGSWLGFVDTIDASLCLSNPYYNDVIVLPSMEFLPSVYGVVRDPTSGSILKYKVRVRDDEADFWDESGVHDSYCYKLVDPALMAETAISNLCVNLRDVVMAVQGETPRLAYCYVNSKITSKNTSVWYGLQEDYNPLASSSNNQIVYSSKYGLFYTIFDGMGIQSFDVEYDRGRRSKNLSRFWMKELRQLLDKQQWRYSEALRRRWCCKSKRYYDVNDKHYLVTLNNGDLLLIVRHYQNWQESDTESTKTDQCDMMNPPPHETVYFDVFRVVYPGELERVSCLEDQAIFIGGNQSFCIKAGKYPGIIPNSIYFTDDLPDAKDWGHDNGIFTLSNGVISPCYPYHDEPQEKKVPITAPLFWVPPFH